MRINAKFSGKCATCKKPIAKGDEIEYVDKKAHHAECFSVESDVNDADQLALAESLGFVRGAEATTAPWARICEDWALRNLRAADRRDPAGRTKPETHSRPEPSLF